MKSILLIDTGIATQNIGDEIINRSIEFNWPELFRKACIYRLSSHTAPYPLWQQLFFSRKNSAFGNADYKFLCGTNALYTNMLRPVPGWNIHLWNYMIYSGTILLGVGAGINSRAVNLYTKYLYSKVLNKEYYHSVRDDYTVELLTKLGYKAINTGCPTMWGFTSEFCKDIPTKKANDVVFSLTGYQPDVLNDKLMIEILQKNYSNLFFWPQTLADIEYLKSLGNYRYQIIPPNLCVYDEILDQNVDYIGNRLHGGIRALQHKKRTVIIAIDYRARNMGTHFSLPIIERNKIAHELSERINEDFKTNIVGINQDNINMWKSQFQLVNE